MHFPNYIYLLPELRKRIDLVLENSYIPSWEIILIRAFFSFQVSTSNWPEDINYS